MAGSRTAQSGAKLAINSFSEQFTWTPSSHTFKAGVGYSDNQGTFIQATNQVGTFTFNRNEPFDPANAFTYPIRFQATLGNIRFPINDKRTYAFVSDKWALHNKVTLNLGVRHDYSEMTPQKDAFAPQARRGVCARSRRRRSAPPSASSTSSPRPPSSRTS